jgi:hypothetical protein
VKAAAAAFHLERANPTMLRSAANVTRMVRRRSARRTPPREASLHLQVVGREKLLRLEVGAKVARRHALPARRCSPMDRWRAEIAREGRRLVTVQENPDKRGLAVEDGDPDVRWMRKSKLML